MTKRYNRNFVKKELIAQINVTKGICETLRLIYDDVHYIEEERKERVTELLIDAMIMAKKMSSRLAYYKDKYNEKTGNSGKNLEKMPSCRERKKARWQRWLEIQPSSTIPATKKMKVLKSV